MDRTILSDVLPAREEANYANVKQAVIQYLTEQNRNIQRSLHKQGAVILPHDFLFLDKEGYSVHYATAATLMFRACGIPARYVEGYLITSAGRCRSFSFSDRWYACSCLGRGVSKRVGWIPVEVTPPYFGLMEEADSLEGVPGTRPESTPAASPENNTVENQEEIPNQVDGEKAVAGNLLLIILIIVLVAAAIFFLWRYWKKKTNAV